MAGIIFFLTLSLPWEAFRHAKPCYPPPSPTLSASEPESTEQVSYQYTRACLQTPSLFLIKGFWTAMSCQC